MMDRVRVEIEFEVEDADFFESWVKKAGGRRGVHVTDFEYFFRTKKAGKVVSVNKDKSHGKQ